MPPDNNNFVNTAPIKNPRKKFWSRVVIWGQRKKYTLITLLYEHKRWKYVCTDNLTQVTGKSLSEAPFFASIWWQIVHVIASSIHENSKLKPWENMLCTEIVSDIQNNFCTQHVLQKEELLTKIYLYSYQNQKSQYKRRTTQIELTTVNIDISTSKDIHRNSINEMIV